MLPLISNITSKYFIQNVKKLYPVSKVFNFTTAVNMEKYKSQSTVDMDDVEKHTKLASKWWDPEGPMKALHAFNLIRVPFVRDGLVQCPLHERNLMPLKNLNILDVGCGGGILSEPLARLGATVTGIDASKELITLAQTHACQDIRLSNNLPNYICTTVEDYVRENNNHYDGVVASEIIEHVDDKELFIKSCVQALKKGGRIFFTTPNRTKLSQFFGIYMAEYVLNIVPRGTHQFEKFVTPPELTFLLERNNCHVELIYGGFYNILTNTWQWTESKSLLFALQAVKIG